MLVPEAAPPELKTEVKVTNIPELFDEAEQEVEDTLPEFIDAAQWELISFTEVDAVISEGIPSTTVPRTGMVPTFKKDTL